MEELYKIKKEKVEPKKGLCEKTLTYIVPYYNNPSMFLRQLGHWAALPPDVLKRWNFIVIDDCSSLQHCALNMWNAFHHTHKTKLAKQLNIYYILQDSLFGQHEARNIGVYHTETEYNFLTDMDMELDSSSFAALLDKLDGEINQKNYYSVGRRQVLDDDGNTKEKKYHCNTFVVSQTNYWKINGYDVDYVGTYGGDGPFARQLEQFAPRKHLDDIVTLLYGRDVIADASTSDVQRYGDPKTNYRRILKWKNKEPSRGRSIFPIRRVFAKEL